MRLLLPMLLGIGLAWAATPEERAVTYLAGEVPAWSRDNGCFSCHNNGDGARALYFAAARKYAVPAAALAATTAWLSRPGDWENKVEDASFKDKKLARIQFAAALSSAFVAGMVTDCRLLEQAGDLLLPYQERDGSWVVDAANAAGSPATYGTSLATYMAREVLQSAGGDRFAAAIRAADRWLSALKPANHVDAAVLLLHSGPKRADASAVLLRNQTRDGGWGPHRASPPESFDTALAVMALHRAGGSADAVVRGRAFLIRTQLPNGGWPETTRPPGAQSYAQHISTSAWATLALLATDPERH